MDHFILLIVSIFIINSVLGQEAIIWHTDVEAVCGSTSNTSCVDKHLGEIFSNLTGVHLQQPNSEHYIDNYFAYKPYQSTIEFDRNVAMNAIIKMSYNQSYNQSELDIINAFPRYPRLH
ncbi:hypothetical protein RDWZM_005136 [Blomia tropicalis]|uniref:Uncharacterized protein n=1 Tax=Blomia tropicalis TaxID=40697 RepID=A0A9Q0RM20_BLOTA|nr:hypothetical protein BLOT_005579 [Blomia tropicalis]KAJ6219324.1 hypothetical protein RDWZM_005136 [Blomia tropicalis]